MNIVDETGKQVGNFFDIMRRDPLALSLVVSNFILLGFLFYSGSSQLSHRRETVDLIVKWQADTDKLMASCVSAEIMAMVLKALERDRSDQSGRKPLPPEVSPKQ
jgi:hypothetical protein